MPLPEWTIELRTVAGGRRQWELMEGAAHRGLFDTEAEAIGEACQLGAGEVYNRSWDVFERCEYRQQ